MLNPPLVSVIYVSYNCTELLFNSVRSLRQQCSQVSYEIIIVDNASTGREVQRLRDGISAYPEARLILSEKNLGFGKANNLGSLTAKGKYLFFLNPDTVVVNDVLGIFSAFLESSPGEVAACGGSLLKPDLTPNDSYGNFPGLMLEICNVGIGIRYLFNLFNQYYRKHIAIASPVCSDQVIKVPYIVGADIFIRADLFSVIGRFDEDYFMYYEETDLFYRLARKGYSGYILPQARIIHLEGASIGESRQEFNRKKFHHLLYSKLTYFRKWYPGSVPLLNLLIAVQLLVQYGKGKLGRDFSFIRKEYFGAVKAGRDRNGGFARVNPK